MAQHAPGSKPDSTQRSRPSKKPSAYMFDSNGDTRIILSTHLAQTLKWEADKIWIEEKKLPKAYYKMKKREMKKWKRLPPAPRESHVAASTSLGGTTSAPPIDWGKVDLSEFLNASDSPPEIADGDETDPGCTVPGTNADSTSLQIQDWEYGETCRPHLKKLKLRMLVSGKHLELASPIFKTMVTGPFAEGKTDVSGFRQITASDWDPEAFNIILTIMHGYNRDVPRSLSLEMLV
ncbi:uncharacterized protein FFNC_14717 [Fusarium fujikuroi]|uniref:BTB domain-containing protein n=1 Tax=Fusarium fujikuroi TaxID=5127 RepID=A0A9Q9UHE0_FUSFU|nr:uncharacterized protein FFNC_14717 [Fusarium fujikuroi]VTT83153.1 unnamed protein product [Fusarium fujikuroi]